MKLSIAINVHESYQDTIALATTFDREGFDQIWIVDFPAPRYAPPIAAEIASMTKLRIGIGLISSQIYDSDYVIRWLETLVEEFGYRFDLLVGPGDKLSLERIGLKKWIPKQVASHTIEVTRRIRKRVLEADLRCSVILGAQGPRMIRESSSFDGVLLNLSDTAMITWAKDIMRQTSDDFDFGVFVPTEIVRESDGIPSLEFRYAAAVIALGAPKALLKEFNIERSVEAARRIRHVKGKLNDQVLNALGTEMIQRWGLHTTPNKVNGYVTQLACLGVKSLVFGPPLSNNIESAKLLVEGLHRS